MEACATLALVRIGHWAVMKWDRVYRRKSPLYRAPLGRRRRDRVGTARCECLSGAEGSRDIEQRLRSVPAGGRLSVLVHGTFDRHAKWGRSGPMFDTLGRDGAIVRFCWSGRNRVRDRVEAAELLRNTLLLVRQLRPDIDVLVVAHSHGGNVALHAIRGFTSSEGERRVLADVRVATLATPFLSASVAQLPPFFRAFKLLFGLVVIWSLVVLVVIAGWLAFALLVSVGNWLGVSTDIHVTWNHNDAIQAGFLAVFCTIFGSTLPIYVSSLLSYGRRASSPPLRRLFDPAALRLECLRYITSPSHSLSNHLAIRAQGDEAGAGLAFASMATWMADWIIARLRLVTVIVVSYAVIVAFAVASVWIDPTGWPRLPISGVVVTIATVILVAAACIIVLALLCRLVGILTFGADVLFLGWRVRFEVESIPRPGGFLAVLSNAPTVRQARLHHGICDDVEAVDLVHAFLLRRFAVEKVNEAQPEVWLPVELRDSMKLLFGMPSWIRTIQEICARCDDVIRDGREGEKILAALRLRAYISLELVGDLTAALGDSELLVADSQSQTDLALRAIALYRAGHLQDAERTLSGVPEAADTTLIWAARAFAALLLGKSEVLHSRDMLRRLDSDWHNIPALIACAMIHYNSGHFADASEACRRVLVVSPVHPTALIINAACSVREGRSHLKRSSRGVVAEADLVVEVLPFHYMAYILRACAWSYAAAQRRGRAVLSRRALEREIILDLRTARLLNRSLPDIEVMRRNVERSEYLRVFS